MAKGLSVKEISDEGAEKENSNEGAEKDSDEGVEKEDSDEGAVRADFDEGTKKILMKEQTQAHSQGGLGGHLISTPPHPKWPNPTRCKIIQV